MVKPALPLLILSLSIGSCSDILEEDLDGQGVVLLTPASGYTTTVNQIQFRWEAVPNATSYRLQVARPDLIEPLSFPVDSTMSSTSFTFSFTPGTYQWRVRAENGQSHTDWFSRAFIIASSESLTGQIPVLVSPANGSITNGTSVTFQWDTLPFTGTHHFELRANSQTGSVLQELSTPANEVTLDALADGHYAWGVQARNNVPSASEYAFRLLTIDATPPSAPTPLLPVNNATTADHHVNFIWQSGTDALTATTDSLIVRNVSSQVVVAESLLSAPFADSLATGTYTWIVRTLDAAGNGTSSALSIFTVP